MFRKHVSLTIIVLVLASLIGGCATAGTPSAPTAPTQATAGAVSPTQPATATAATPTAAAAAMQPTSVVAKAANPELILATTTSTTDSGLLDVLIPLFQKQTGYNVKTTAVGSGAAMTMGERGEADVLLVHAPDSEKTFMAAGHGIDRRLVMHNDFIIIGPAADPAKIKGENSAISALQKIAAAKAIFYGRGDNSGTDQLEQKLWKAANTTPKGQSWYQQTGQGMGATLNVTAEKSAYTISDRATYLTNQKNLNLAILVEGDTSLLNVYHVIMVNPSKSVKINAQGARAFADFIVAKDTQVLIATFGVGKYGQPLFIPDAGKTEAAVGL